MGLDLKRKDKGTAAEPRGFGSRRGRVVELGNTWELLAIPAVENTSRKI